MDLELGGSYQRGTIVETHKSDQSGEGTLSSLIQDIYTENKVGMENTNLNESWHRIILFLQAKCVCVCFQVARGLYFGNAATQQQSRCLGLLCKILRHFCAKFSRKCNQSHHFSATAHTLLGKTP